MNSTYRFELFKFDKDLKIDTNIWLDGYMNVNGDVIEEKNYKHTSKINVKDHAILELSYFDYQGVALYDGNLNFMGFLHGKNTYNTIVNLPSNVEYVVINTLSKFVEGGSLYNIVPLFAYAGNSQTVHPNYKADIAIDIEQETNQQFYRQKLSSKLTFIGKEYEDIASMPFETSYLIDIYESSNNWKTEKKVLRGRFMQTDCKFDECHKLVEVDIETVDDYDSILDNIDKEFDLIKLAPENIRLQISKRSMIQVYVLGDSAISCFLAPNYWTQEVNSPTMDRHLVTEIPEEGGYGFNLNNILYELNVKITGSYSDASALYTGNVPQVNEGLYSGTLYPDGDKGYYINLTLTKQGAWWTYGIDLKDINGSIKYYYRAFTNNTPYWDNEDVPLTADNDASGSGIAEMANYWIYARLLTNSEGINGTATHVINDKDIVPFNRNYNRELGFNFGIARISNVSSSEPTEWGLRDDGRYYDKPNKEVNFFPISKNFWRYSSLWLTYNDRILNLEKGARTAYVLRDSAPIYSVIQSLLNAVAPGILHEGTPEYSMFLYGNTPILNDGVIPIITQKSNILNGDYDEPANKAPITLQQVMNMLRDCFQCYWYISEGKLRIEHISYFKKGMSYGMPLIGADLTSKVVSRNQKKWDYDTNEWEFNKEDMPVRYTFAYMDKVSDAFAGYPIDVISKYVKKNKIEEINVSNFTPDIDYILLNPDAISVDGFALFGAVYREMQDGNYNIGTKVNPDNGNILTNSNYACTQYMAVLPNMQYKLNYAVDYACYDRGLNYVSGGRTAINQAIILMPPIAYYIRISMRVSESTLFKFSTLELPMIDYRYENTTFQMQNGIFSWRFLHPNCWVYDLPARKVLINNVLTNAKGTKRTKKQEIVYPNLDIDPNLLIKTGIGSGKIVKNSVSLRSKMNKITINHDIY